MIEVEGMIENMAAAAPASMPVSASKQHRWTMNLCLQLAVGCVLCGHGGMPWVRECRDMGAEHFLLSGGY